MSIVQAIGGGHIQAILFDLDGTLHDRGDLGSSLHQRINSRDLPFNSHLLGRRSSFRSSLHSTSEGMSADRWFTNACVGSWASQPALSQALLADYFLAYPKFSIGFPGMVETLVWLREQGLKLAIVTNGSSSVQSAKIRALGISDYFDVIVISEAEGVSKPNRRIFDLATDRLGAMPAEAIFVGDHPKVDQQWRSKPRACGRFGNVTIIGERVSLCRRSHRRTA